jgi:hypothetical protein
MNGQSCVYQAAPSLVTVDIPHLTQEKMEL